jgi:hypothetical protein
MNTQKKKGTDRYLPIRIFLLKSEMELVLRDALASGDETAGGNHAEFFDFRGKKDARWS